MSSFGPPSHADHILSGLIISITLVIPVLLLLTAPGLLLGILVIFIVAYAIGRLANAFGFYEKLL